MDVPRRHCRSLRDAERGTGQGSAELPVGERGALRVVWGRLGSLRCVPWVSGSGAGWGSWDRGLVLWAGGGVLIRFGGYSADGIDEIGVAIAEQNSSV